MFSHSTSSCFVRDTHPTGPTLSLRWPLPLHHITSHTLFIPPLHLSFYSSSSQTNHIPSSNCQATPVARDQCIESVQLRDARDCAETRLPAESPLHLSQSTTSRAPVLAYSQPILPFPGFPPSHLTTLAFITAVPAAPLHRPAPILAPRPPNRVRRVSRFHPHDTGHVSPSRIAHASRHR